MVDPSIGFNTWKLFYTTQPTKTMKNIQSAEPSMIYALSTTICLIQQYIKLKKIEKINSNFKA